MTTQTTRQTARFKDFYNDFDVHPVRGDLYVLEDADAVKTSIKNLIFTNPGERPFAPLIGAGIKRMLFEPVSSDTAYMIKSYIEISLENYEPRARILAVYVNPTADEQGYNIQIVFSLINNPTPIAFNVMLTRVR